MRRSKTKVEASPLEQFLEMEFAGPAHTFNTAWLRELQNQIKSPESDSWWIGIDKIKLNECRNDRARMMQDMKSLLEKWFEGPVYIGRDASTQAKETGEDCDEDELPPSKKS